MAMSDDQLSPGPSQPTTTNDNGIVLSIPQPARDTYDPLTAEMVKKHNKKKSKSSHKPPLATTALQEGTSLSTEEHNDAVESPVEASTTTEGSIMKPEETVAEPTVESASGKDASTTAGELIETTPASSHATAEPPVSAPIAAASDDKEVSTESSAPSGDIVAETLSSFATDVVDDGEASGDSETAIKTDARDQESKEAAMADTVSEDTSAASAKVPEGDSATEVADPTMVDVEEAQKALDDQTLQEPAAPVVSTADGVPPTIAAETNPELDFSEDSLGSDKASIEPEVAQPKASPIGEEDKPVETDAATEAQIDATSSLIPVKEAIALVAEDPIATPTAVEDLPVVKEDVAGPPPIVLAAAAVESQLEPAPEVEQDTTLVKEEEAKEAARRAAEEEEARRIVEQEAKQKEEAATKKREEEQAAQRKIEEEAAAQAESKRLADIEAKRLEEEAEAKRLEEARIEAEQAKRAEDEAARIAAEQEAARIAAEQEAARIAAEEEAARIAAEKEAARIVAEQEAARVAAEQEAARIAAEEAARVAAEEEAARIAAEEEAARIAAEEARIAAEQEAARIEAARVAAEEEAARVAAEQEAARIAAEQEAARVEAARIAAEEEAARIAAEQEAARIAAEQEAARIAAEEEASRIAAEEAARVAAEEEAAREAARVAAEQEAKRIAEEEAARIAAEQEAARVAAEKAARIAAEEEAARIAAEQEAARIESARIAAEEEAARVAAEEEAARIAAEQEAREAARIAAEEAARIAAEEEAARIAAEQEAARIAAEEEAARIAAEEEAKRVAEEEAQRKIEEARLKEIEEIRLRELEETRLKELEETRLKELEETRLKELEEARIKAEEAELQRVAQEEAAARKREEEATQRKIDEEAAAAEAETKRLVDEAEAQRFVEEEGIAQAKSQDADTDSSVDSAPEPVTPIITLEDTKIEDASAVEAASVVERAASSSPVPRPKSPFPASFQVSTVGRGSTPQEEEADPIPIAAPAPLSTKDAVSPIARSLTPSYSVHSQGGSPLQVAQELKDDASESQVPTEQIPSIEGKVDGTAVASGKVDEHFATNESAVSSVPLYVPSYSISRQGSPRLEAKEAEVESLPKEPAAKSGHVVDQVTNKAAETVDDKVENTDVFEHLPEVVVGSGSAPAAAPQAPSSQAELQPAAVETSTAAEREEAQSTLSPLHEGLSLSSITNGASPLIIPDISAGRKRLESSGSGSSKFFPGGWYSAASKIPDESRPSLETASGEFIPSKSPISPLPAAEETGSSAKVPPISTADLTVQPAENGEQSSASTSAHQRKWCVVM